MLDKADEEIWKTYPDYDFIEVSNLGKIRTKDRYVTDKNGVKRFIKGRVLKQQLNPNGYMHITFSMNGKTVNLRVHRAVAICFVSNPDNLPEVNHIDCDPTNNRGDNLEWCTRQENIAYRDKLGYTAKYNAPKKPVFAVDLKTGKVMRFESQSEAARQLGIDDGELNKVVNGQYIQAGGDWFTEDENEITEEKIREIRAKMKLCSVIVINPETSEVFWFESQSEAARQLGINVGHMNEVIKGKRNKAGGCWFTDAESTAIEKTREKFGDEFAEKVEELMRQN